MTGTRQRRLCERRFERLREQLATAAVYCDEEQVLDLADELHAILRRRRKASTAGREGPRADLRH